MLDANIVPFTSAAPAAFDYSQLSRQQEMELKAISVRLRVHSEQAAEAIIRVGFDLIEAKGVLKDNDEMFMAWCESGECPVGKYKTCSAYMKIASEFGSSTIGRTPNAPWRILAEIAYSKGQVRDALLEHVNEKEAAGERVTRQEVIELKRALKEAQQEGIEKEKLLAEAYRKMEEAQRKLEEKEAAIKRSVDVHMEDTKAKKKLKDQIASLEETLNLMRNAHSEELAQREERIRKEMAERPLTSDEKKRLQEEMAKVREEKKAMERDIEKLREERFRMQRELDKQERAALDRRRAIARYTQSLVNVQREHFDVVAALRGEIVEPDLYGALVTLRDTLSQHIGLIDNVLAIDGRTVNADTDA